MDFFSHEKSVRKDTDEDAFHFFFTLGLFLMGAAMLSGAGYFLWDWGWPAVVQGRIQDKPSEWIGWVFIGPGFISVYFLFASLYRAYSLIREACATFAKKPA